MIKILHFSPVRKSAEIVKCHLESIKNLNIEGLDITFSFIDDNTDPESSLLLENFIKEVSHSFIHSFETENVENYNGKQRWVPNLYSRITKIKDYIIGEFLKGDYDYLFLTDSDLILNPESLSSLVQQNKNFCSCIFWTHFEGAPTFTPNAWYSKLKGYEVNDILQLKEKATFPVDYTGACTLLSRKILETGVRFEKIPNINYRGEDKHFCIRAAVLGFQPYVNTEYPAFHIYNESLLPMGLKLLQNKFEYDYHKDWLDESWEAEIKRWLMPKRQNLLKRILAKLNK